MPVLKADQVAPALLRGSSAKADASASQAPRFKPNDSVIARNINPLSHTRLPRYVRGKRGVIVRDYGPFIFPDSHAASGYPAPQHVYSVRFTAAELWGEPSGSHTSAVYVDLWDSYLEPV